MKSCLQPYSCHASWSLATRLVRKSQVKVGETVLRTPPIGPYPRWADYSIAQSSMLLSWLHESSEETGRFAQEDSSIDFEQTRRHSRKGFPRGQPPPNLICRSRPDTKHLFLS